MHLGSASTLGRCLGRRQGRDASGPAPPRPVICAGIHMSDIPSLPYRLLWGERTVRSVANLTRLDAREFLALAATTPLVVHAHPYRLADAHHALEDLRAGNITGAAVLTCDH